MCTYQKQTLTLVHGVCGCILNVSDVIEVKNVMFFSDKKKKVYGNTFNLHTWNFYIEIYATKYS